MAASSKKVIYAALVGNAAIAVTKFIAAGITGSSAMLSEGIHSVVDTGNQVLMLYGLRRGRKPPDDAFPFGHGKEIYFWSFIVAILIFAVGAGVSIYEGVIHLQDPHPVASPMVNYLVLILAMAFEGGAWYFAWKEFGKVRGKRGYIEAVRRAKDPSMFVVLFEDSAAMLGLVAAFVGVYLGELTGSPYFDGAASILIGLILGGTAIWLAYETHGLLIGESASKEVIETIRQIASRQEQVRHVNEILTMHMGPDFILVNVSVDFGDSTTAVDLQKTIAEIDRAIKDAVPTVRRVFIEAEARQRVAPAPDARF